VGPSSESWLYWLGGELRLVHFRGSLALGHYAATTLTEATPSYLLNNTAIASPRILIPILENFQQADGSVVIPEPLRPYLGGRDRLVPRR